MTPALLEKTVGSFQNMVGAAERVGVSEFARSKDWRKRLPKTGCFEVVDRSGVVGYMLAPEYAVALSDRIAQLEQLVEQAQIAAMFKAREGYNDVKTGAELRVAVEESFNARIDSLMGEIHAD